MRCLFGFIWVLVLAAMGCSESSTGSQIKSGLWVGGSPASNADGEPFDTGWAICFHVNEDGTALTPSTDCSVDGSEDGENVWSLEVAWKNDVGRDEDGNVGECNGSFDQDRESEGFTNTYAIEDNSFEIPQSITGTFEGDTATGTARWVFTPGMGPGAECELVGGWTASPAE